MIGILLFLIVLAVPTTADPLRLTHPKATFYAGSADDFACVVDGVPEGPRGWSPAPKVSEPQALIVECERPVEADELDIDLFFLAGRPWNALAEFSLSFTTDPQPSLLGNWMPLEISRFAADVNNLRRTEDGKFHLDYFRFSAVGNQPDDVYRMTARLPGGSATGFRLDAFPVHLQGKDDLGLSWWSPYDFTLTEFRVGVHVRQTTNIALHQPVTSSHALYDVAAVGQSQKATNLTDGLPATIAHPKDSHLGPDFHFDIDLGRIANLDHIGLRNRGDSLGADRMTQLRLKLFEQAPDEGSAPSWTALLRADGSIPAPGVVDAMRSHHGKGSFRGRYLRISSESGITGSPQLAEVEVYETRTPVLVSAIVDGIRLDAKESLEIPPGARRISLQLAIPQTGKPPGNLYRWRMREGMKDWQETSQFTIDIASPKAGNYLFMAQAMHSDNEWDASVFRMPITVRQHLWENPIFRMIGFIAVILAAVILSRWIMHRRTTRQLAAANARAALAEERARIARDMHDEVGGKLARLAMLGDLAQHRQHTSAQDASSTLSKLTKGVREVAAELEQVIWSLNPKNDCVSHLAHHIYHDAEEFFADTPIHCRFGAMADIPSWVTLAPETRNALFRSFKEAAANILKHSQATEAKIDFRYTDGLIEICIQDNGCGFDPNAILTVGEHNGLTNMRDRMISAGGSCLINSSPKGTTVILRWQKS